MPAIPNPFNPQTKISYRLAEDAFINLAVYNIQGRRISRLIENVSQSPGSYSIHWNGKNDLGQTAASGTYILYLQAGDFVQSQKVMLTR